MITALSHRISARKLSLAPIVLAAQARVALGDPIGQALAARVSIVLIGERPGLSAADSLGAYMTLDPKVGRTDAERNCVSNIRPGGLPIEQATDTLAWLAGQAFRLGLTGVALKDGSGMQTNLPEAGAALASPLPDR